MSDTPAPPSIQMLYVDHHQWLVGWLRRQLSCTENAADLAQDTFVRVLNRPQALLGVREPRAWLATVARRLMVDQLRRQRLEQAYAETLAHFPDDDAPPPEQQLMLLESLNAIDQLLEGMGPKVRAAFLLSRLEGLTYPEIADQLQVSLSSVEKYMAKAIRHCYLIQQTL